MRFLSVLAIATALVPSIAAEAANLRLDGPLIEVFQQLGTTASIPRGAQRVPFLTVTFTANCADDFLVRSIAVTHKGRGDRRELLRVYAFDGSRRLSSAVSINAGDGSAVLRFRDFILGACMSKRIEIFADISPDAEAGGEHRLVLADEDHIRAETVTDGAPARIKLDERLSDAPLRIAGGEGEGTLHVEYLKLPQTLSYGRNQTLARFKLTADDVADHAISAITLTNEGSARGNHLQRLRLETQTRAVVSDVKAELEDDRVRLALDPPLILENNQSVILFLRADIYASRRRTVSFRIKEPADIEANVLRIRRK